MTYDVLIVGGGAAGIAVASSILKRNNTLKVCLIEPGAQHYYQPGFTLVGGGVFNQAQTRRQTDSLIPKNVDWIKEACASFDPEHNRITLENGEHVDYRVLIAAPGLKLNWDAIDGLNESIGRNGVTSNYRFDMAPYTWELVQSLRSGRALFTQPAMPIKCAGAPQKAMYLACDAWRRQGALSDISVSFHNAGDALFGVADYVPALMTYIERYGVDLRSLENLVAVDGDQKTATFDVKNSSGDVTRITKEFEMIHVCPPQTGLDFVKDSPLSNEAGWIDVNQHTLQHTRYENVFGLGDATSTPNAKTAAAVRQQAPVVAFNAIEVLQGKAPRASYNGYGSCPLTVERGKIVLAEFSYGGVLDPTFPKWIINGLQPSSLAWFLKEKMLPTIYFEAMLKGREWLAKPTILSEAPTKTG